MMLVSSSSSSSSSIFFHYSAFSSFQVLLPQDGIVVKMKEIKNKLDVITKAKDKFNFGKSGTSIEKQEQPQIISLIDESQIYGPKETRTSLIEKLCKSSELQKRLHVISLVGKKGIGKTTLAKFVYRNKSVIEHFDKRLWVFGSDLSDEFKIAKAVIEALEGPTSKFGELDSLLIRISKAIMGKKILLVLDNVQTDDHEKWKSLYRCLKNSLYGESKILITTHEKSVAEVMQSIDILPLNELSDEECWSWFRRLAFSNKTRKECQELTDQFRKQVVDKCKGLPLAIKLMGSLVRFKKVKLEWQNILYNEIWKVEVSEIGDLLPFLWLSYDDLPLMMKRCFLYCAVFPKNFQIYKDQLIKLWMAQGFFKLEKEKKIEKIGQKCFDQLVARSFFQEFEIDDDGSIISYKMHDIVHNFIQFLTKHECLVMEISDLEASDITTNEKARQLMLMLSYKGDSFPNSFVDSFKGLRSLLVQSEVTNYSRLNEALPKLFDQLLSLRALDISGKFWYENLIVKIPNEIGKLMHLRYLNLSLLKVEELPETLCELFNLQTLELKWCITLNKLPERMGNLINLRHMVNDKTSLSYLPKGIERLTCLQTLSEFVVSGRDHAKKACTLECLKNLKYLCGSLSIKKLGNATDWGHEAQKAKLIKENSNLRHLYLNFEKDIEVDLNENEEGRRTTDNVVLEALEPHQKLEQLEIRDYKGYTISSNWILSLSNLRMLSLHDCMNFKHLPPLGEMSSLESLVISSMRGIESVGAEFLRRESVAIPSNSLFVTFPKLKSLKFVNMKEWKEWTNNMVNGMSDKFSDSTTTMPCLHSLSFLYCPKLEVVPKYILKKVTIKELNINWCRALTQRCDRNKELHKIAPNIMINFKHEKQKDQPRNSQSAEEAQEAGTEAKPQSPEENHIDAGEIPASDEEKTS